MRAPAPVDYGKLGWSQPKTFGGLDAVERGTELRKTRRAVQEYLSERPRGEFPSVEVVYCGRIVPPHVVDAAYTRASYARLVAGKPEGFDWIAAIERALPGELQAERDRIASMAPLPRRLGGEGNAMWQRDRFPVGLMAPLVLGSEGEG